MRPLRLAFMGTPDFSVPILEALVAAGHEVACVYCQPPRPAGRGQQLQAAPVQRRAEALGLPVRHPKSLRRPEPQAEFADLGLDAAVVAAYGLILPPPILAAPRLGCLNVHASLLPRWRGAAPIQRAIEAGDAETGVVIMQMDEGLDTGGMLLTGRVPIGPHTTAQDLHDTLSALGARLILPALDGVAGGTLEPVAQPEQGITYAAKLTKEEGRLDLTRAADHLDRQVRAFTPWPGCWLDTVSGERLKVLAVEPLPELSGGPGIVLDADLTMGCGAGALRLTRVQRPGKGPVTGADYLRGAKLAVGDRLVAPFAAI